MKKPERNAAYLRFVRTQICCVPGCRNWITEAAHVGARGLGQRCSDREAIALCQKHHRTGKHSQHTLGKNFWSHHGLDKDAIVADLNRRFERERAA